MTLEQEVVKLRAELDAARAMEHLMESQRDSALHGPRSWIQERHRLTADHSRLVAAEHQWRHEAQRLQGERDALVAARDALAAEVARLQAEDAYVRLRQERDDARAELIRALKDAREVPGLRVYLKQAKTELKEVQAQLAQMRAEDKVRRTQARRFPRAVADADYVTAWYALMERRSEWHPS